MIKAKDEFKISLPQIPARLENLDITDKDIQDEDSFNMATISDCYIE
jgi:hypothetical protein